MYDPESPLLLIYQTEMCAQVYQKIGTRMFVAAVFIGAKSGNDLNSHQWQNGCMRCDTSTQMNTVEKYKHIN